MIYHHQERGVEEGSRLFLSTPSKIAESVLFYLHRCGHFVCSREYAVVRNNYNNFFVFCVDEGRMKIVNEGKTYIAEKGDVGIINCHVPHAYYSLTDQTVYKFLHFSGSNSHDFYRHIRERSPVVFSVSKDSVITKDIHWLLAFHQEMEDKGIQKVPEDQVSSRLHDILCAMLFQASEKGYTINPSRKPVIEQAVSYIREHYMEPMEVNVLADLVNVSRYHFSRMFKEEVGYSPHEYITLLRINRAKELLKSTDLPMSEIAFRVGYEYSTSFTAVFQKKVGVTPREFRKMPI